MTNVDCVSYHGDVTSQVFTCGPGHPSPSNTLLPLREGASYILWASHILHQTITDISSQVDSMLHCTISPFFYFPPPTTFYFLHLTLYLLLPSTYLLHTVNMIMIYSCSSWPFIRWSYLWFSSWIITFLKDFLQGVTDLHIRLMGVDLLSQPNSVIPQVSLANHHYDVLYPYVSTDGRTDFSCQLLPPGKVYRWCVQCVLHSL